MPHSESVSSGTAAEELREWRRERALTQRDAAGVIKTSAQTISDYEKGRKQPSLELAVRIEDATGIPPRAWVRKAA